LKNAVGASERSERVVEKQKKRVTTAQAGEHGVREGPGFCLAANSQAGCIA
jgi:hypothetical protein